MAILTKEEVLEKVLAQPRPQCPHCGEAMSLWEIPPLNFSDGLGWGEPYLFVCFNDTCPMYVQGWQNIQENFAHKASTRCLCYPSTGTFDCMPVFSPQGGRGQIIDKEILAQRARMEKATKEGLAKIAEARERKDHVLVLQSLLDAALAARVRLAAAEALAEIGVLESLEPMKNINVGNHLLQEKITLAIAAIHERTFTRECPFCAEIIKQRAKICKHCGKEVA